MTEITVNGRTLPAERLLGKGKGGYSYLCRLGDQPVVVKQIHHEPCAYYTFGDKLASELRDYERLQAAGIPLPRMLEVDHAAERIVKEYVCGPVIYDLALQDAVTADHLAQVRRMAELARAAGLNIDYFPTNFVVQDGVMFYIDYECNPYMEQWDFEHWGVRYWSRTPELLAHAAAHGHA